MAMKDGGPEFVVEVSKNSLAVLSTGWDASSEGHLIRLTSSEKHDGVGINRSVDGGHGGRY